MLEGVMAKDNDDQKRISYSIDIREFEELKNAIFEYFLLMSDLLDKDGFEIEKVELFLDIDKVLVRGIQLEPEEDSDTDDDLEWI